MIITINADHEAASAVKTIKRGDDLLLYLVFLDSSRSPYLPDWDTVVYGGKLRGDYDGDFLLYSDDFKPGQTPDGTPCLMGHIRLSGAALTELIGSGDTITLATEVNLQRVGQAVSTNTLSLTIHNDLIKGVEGTELGSVPEYALKSYVDKVVTEGIDERIGDSVRQAAGSAADARQDAMASANSAALSAGSAGVSAREARDAEDAARRAEESQIALLDIDSLNPATPPDGKYTYDPAGNIFILNMKNTNTFVRIFCIPSGAGVVNLRLTNVRDGDFLRLYVVKPAGVQLQLFSSYSGNTALALIDGSKIQQSAEYLFTITRLRNQLRAISTFVVGREIQ